MLDTPERRRIPAGPQLDLPSQPFSMPAAAFPVGPLQFHDPFQNNYAPAPAPAYHHLPPNLALAITQLPPLIQPTRGRGRGRLRGRGNFLNWRPVQNPPAVVIPPVSLKSNKIYVYTYNTYISLYLLLFLLCL